MGKPERISPRLLTRQQAAAYCSVSIGTFIAHCPVRPVSMGQGRRLDRFDIQALDEWIDGMRQAVHQPQRSWLDRL